MNRITQVRIRNVRAIEALDLDVSRMTVLIGENGAGKSTIIECLEVLRKVANPRFFALFYAEHLGLPALLRKGATSLSLAATVELDGSEGGGTTRLSYEIEIGDGVGGGFVVREALTSEADGVVAFRSNGAQGQVWNPSTSQHDPFHFSFTDEANLSRLSRHAADGRIGRVLKALEGIEVHVAFDTLPSWVARGLQLPQPIRGSGHLYPATRLELRGRNLTHAWAELRGRTSEEWRYTCDLVRLGLGDRFDSVNVKADPGGNVYLSVRFNDLPDQILASQLSDGQIAWLAFVAMVRLNPGRSLLAIDEPEQHLHPALLRRVMQMLKEMEGEAPVVIATHADSVLSMVDDPAASLRILELQRGRAVVRRIDGPTLQTWLEEYSDIGDLRASGYLSLILAEEEEAGPSVGGTGTGP